LHPSIGKWTLIPVDLNYYSEITYYLKQGFESKYGSLSTFGINNIPTKSPYHYAELWLNCFYSTILPNAKIGYTLLYVTYPILISVFFCGIVSFIYEFSNKKLLIIPIAFLTLFLGPIDSIFLRDIFNQEHLLSCNTVIFENNGFFFNTFAFSYHGQKHALFYIVFLLFLFTYQKNTKNAFIILSICPLINFGLLPGLLAGTIMYYIFGFVLNRYRENKITKAYILPILITTIFCGVFYNINGGKDIEKQVSIVFFNSENLNFNGEIARIFFRVFYSICFLILIYSWSLPLLFERKKIPYKIKEILLLLFGIITSVILSRILLDGFNSAQIISYLLPSINIILSFILIYNLFNSNSKIIKIIISFILIIVAYNNIYWTHFHSTTRREIEINKVYSKPFTSKCLMELKKVKNPRIGYFLTLKETSTIESGFWYGYYPCEFIFTKDYFNVYSLNFPYHNKKDGMFDFATNHLRYVYEKDITLEKYNKKINNIIQSKKINFIIIKNDVIIPSSIYKLTRKEIIDPKSGQQFLVLK
jgi:hypothetical protein